jgi:kynurenine formamidase
VIDLSHPITQEMQVFPGYPKPALVPWAAHDAHGYAAEAVFMVTHSGTHVDAPWHFAKRGRRIHEVDPAELVCDAAVLDCRGAGAMGLIGSRMLRDAERACSVRDPRGAAALLATGFGRKWGKPDYLTSYPGLTKEGARHLRDRGYRAVGVDSPNLDHPSDGGFRAHHTLLGSDRLVIENLANLEELLPHRRRRIMLVALPLRLAGASGSPVRAIAMVG